MAAEIGPRVGPEGMMECVGLRSLGDNLVVVDVLVALPVDGGADPEASLEYTYNGLALDYGAEGKGFVVSLCDGTRIPCAPYDYRVPVSTLTTKPHGFSHEFVPRRVPVYGRQAAAAVLPIPVLLSRPLPNGACATVRLNRPMLHYAGIVPSERVHTESAVRLDVSTEVDEHR